MPPFLTCRSISKSFGARPLFRDLTFGVESGERLGLIGPNGSGKSTLLRTLAGVDVPDTGEITRRRGLRVAYVAQEDRFEPNVNVETVLMSAIADQPLEEYERTARLSMTLANAGFANGDQLAGDLSGGWRKRLAIAQAIITEPDLVLLDEPTNHLDLEGVAWLESLLIAGPFASVLVSHDRFLLENVCTRIIELNRAYPDGLLAIDGAYSDFLIKREEFLAGQASRQAALETQAKREIAWLRKSAPARTTKAQGRIDSAERLIDELAEVTFRNSQDRVVDVSFTGSGRRTRELLVAKGIAKALGGRTLISDLDLTLSPKTRLGLIGPNGSGKTTLIRLLTGELPADAGTVIRAPGLRAVHFDQSRAQLDPSKTLRAALSENSDHVIFQGRSTHVTAYARRFLFRAEQLDMPVGALSGGEQARLLIANLMLIPADLLILDEPTNDLDIPSLEALEQCLEEFAGALVLVTHDRYMLDNVSTLMLALDGDGGATFLADFAQWQRTQTVKSAPAPTSRMPSPPISAAGRRMSSQELREWNGMEAAIEAAETLVSSTEARMNNTEVASDAKRLAEAWENLRSARERVTALYDRWAELEEIRPKQRG